MKTIHLVCNAHLDPIWLWEKDEGIAEAISTFRRQMPTLKKSGILRTASRKDVSPIR